MRYLITPRHPAYLAPENCPHPALGLRTLVTMELRTLARAALLYDPDVPPHAARSDLALLFRCKFISNPFDDAIAKMDKKRLDRFKQTRLMLERHGEPLPRVPRRQLEEEGVVNYIAPQTLGLVVDSMLRQGPTAAAVMLSTGWAETAPECTDQITDLVQEMRGDGSMADLMRHVWEEVQIVRTMRSTPHTRSGLDPEHRSPEHILKTKPVNEATRALSNHLHRLARLPLTDNLLRAKGLAFNEYNAARVGAARNPGRAEYTERYLVAEFLYSELRRTHDAFSKSVTALVNDTKRLVGVLAQREATIRRNQSPAARDAAVAKREKQFAAQGALLASWIDVPPAAVAAALAIPVSTQHDASGAADADALKILTAAKETFLRSFVMRGA
jgi:hypothetical protein